ncbi:MAG: coproporphyrinogen III oxidase family protein [Puniceicoccales bacterium]|jgi:oxygen-independent coproporphyrinogen-3 oxidase|nr:coproporphyrinogen III oxidase family protein [Puniceicoccales bacterium]
MHVPFCASRCAYCAFYKAVPSRTAIESYLETLKLEWDLRYRGEPVGTIFWGGGTPSILSARQLETVRRIFPGPLPALKEWTVECSPLTVTKDRLAAMSDIGVTRISIGVETFDEKFLKLLNRQQTIGQIFGAYELVRNFSFDINLDLMFSLPGQKLCQWENDLRQAIALDPDHLSTYCLTLEGETPLATRCRNKMLPAEHGGEKFHRLACELLRTAGYEHYEVSNFARPKKECLHNVHTWQMHDWLGIGPSAASQYNGRRFKNVSDLNQWTFGIRDENPCEEDVCTLDENLLAQDAIIFGLRMRKGIRLPKSMDISNRNACLHLFGSWCDKGYMEYRNDAHYPTERGLLLADALAVEILRTFNESSLANEDGCTDYSAVSLRIVN